MNKRAIVELDDLRERLREAEETLAAIRNGEVDSLVVSGPQGDQVFSLKGAEQPYRVFVEQMLEGAVTLTRSGAILYCNRRFAEMMRSRLERVIGAQVQSFVRAADQSELAEILEDPGQRKTRFVLAAADGSLIPAQLAFSQLPVEDELDAVCVVVTDLTEAEEKRELATALHNLQAAQEQLQRQNDELVRARADAVAANEAKDNFLAALSHELRTPLTPVLMTAAALEEDETISQEVRRDISLLRRNVELEARLIDDLLDITRIARGKVELKRDVIDVHFVLESALHICERDIAAKKLHLEQDLQAEHTRLEADPVRLQQILWNLLRNSIKFTPMGGRITIRSRNEGDQLCLSITDTGIGIDSGKIDRIFAPFEQTDRLITRQFGGLGLGLSISKRLAELHGGTISAQSEGRSRGATFTLTLPLSPLQWDVATAAAAPAYDTTAIKPLRILLVEDHDDTRDALAKLLGRVHHVQEVNCIAKALDVAKRESFDLLISDLGLPDGSGLDLMRVLGPQYNLRGICLSGFGMEEDVARSAEAGFSHHLTKPIDLDMLESVIDAFATLD
jgi:PAS domain S-box-containing protein